MLKRIMTHQRSRRMAAKKKVSHKQTRHVPGRCDCCGCELTEEDRKYNGDRTYLFWRSMISCCTDEQAVGYAEYGGRGVSVCHPWLDSFASFLKDVGECPGPDFTLDLKANESLFEPRNVRWTRIRERESSNWRYESLDLERVRLDLQDFARNSGLDPNILAYRTIRCLPRFN